MKKWILKAIVQKAISFLPFRHKINYFFQKYVTKGVFLSEEYFLDRLQHANDHINAFKKHLSPSLENKTTLELGTGWYPVVPISMFLSGAEKIYTTDISNLCDKEKLQTTLQKFVAYHEEGKLQQFIPVLTPRIKHLKELAIQADEMDLEEILSELNIIYWVKDARNLPLDNESIDLVHSNNTFEHVYPEILKDLLVEFKRIVKKDGIMSHFVDMSDHFAHFDKSINIYNFLKFSDKQWALIDNVVQPQNRWRLPEYIDLYKDLELINLEVVTRPGFPEQVQKMKLDDKYLSVPLQELAVSHCLLISKTA